MTGSLASPPPDTCTTLVTWPWLPGKQLWPCTVPPASGATLTCKTMVLGLSTGWLPAPGMTVLLLQRATWPPTSLALQSQPRPCGSAARLKPAGKVSTI